MAPFPFIGDGASILVAHSGRHICASATLDLGMSDSTQAVDIPPAPAVPPDGRGAPDEVDRLYGDLEARVHAQRPTEDLSTLRKAFEFAAARHLGQKRVSGEPYMVHPLLV